MSDVVLEKLVEEVVALRRRVAALEMQESPRFGYPLGCIVYRSTNQTIADNEWTALSFSAEWRDRWDCWASGNPTRMVAPEDGIYRITGNVEFDSGSGQRGIGVRVNGSIWHATQKTTVTSQRGALNVSVDVEMAAGDYAEIMVWHLTGSSLDVLAADSTYRHNNRGSITRIA